MVEEQINEAAEWLMGHENVVAMAITSEDNEIYYTTDNWDISEDVRKIREVWKKRGQFVKTMGVKFSILQNEETRFVSTNFGKQGSLVAVATAKEPRYYVWAFISPDGDARAMTMETQRAADMIYGYENVDVQEDIAAGGGGGGGGAAAGGAAAQAPSIDPQLKENIDAFLEWIRDPNGLAGYIRYYIDNDDQEVISRLAQVYAKFQQVFGF